MITTSEAKEILGDKESSDKEIREIRDACYILADLALEKQKEDKSKEKNEQIREIS